MKVDEIGASYALKSATIGSTSRVRAILRFKHQHQRKVLFLKFTRRQQKNKQKNPWQKVLLLF